MFCLPVISILGGSSLCIIVSFKIVITERADVFVIVFLWKALLKLQVRTDCNIVENIFLSEKYIDFYLKSNHKAEHIDSRCSAKWNFLIPNI
jgi:hypothetical protein